MGSSLSERMRNLTSALDATFDNASRPPPVFNAASKIRAGVLAGERDPRGWCCPECKWKNEEGALECDNCGHWICPKCGERNNRRRHECRKCYSWRTPPNAPLHWKPPWRPSNSAVPQPKSSKAIRARRSDGAPRPQSASSRGATGGSRPRRQSTPPWLPPWSTPGSSWHAMCLHGVPFAS